MRKFVLFLAMSLALSIGHLVQAEIYNFRVADNVYTDGYFGIHGDNLAYKGNDGYVKIKNIPSGTTYNVASSPNVHIDISDTYVTYMNSAGVGDIWAAEINANGSLASSIFKVAGPGDQWGPTIYKNSVVWMDMRNGMAEIYHGVLDGASVSSTTRLTYANTYANWTPYIYGNNVCWHKRNASLKVVGLYGTNIETGIDYTIRETLNAGAIGGIYENKVAFVVNTPDTGSNEIYLYDIDTQTTQRVTNDSYYQLAVDVYGNFVVWMDYRNGNWDIYAYNMTTGEEIQLTDDVSDQRNPQVYENMVLWFDDRDGGSIYGTYITPPVTWISISDPGFTGQVSKHLITNAQYCQYLNSALSEGLITVENNLVYPAIGDHNIYIVLYPHDNDGQIVYSDGYFIIRSRDGYDMSNHPVLETSCDGAKAFCDYYGYRLLTEWEWEAIADYDGSYTYGCGLTIDTSKANYNQINPLGLTSTPYTTPVDYYPAYGYGLHDMAGNVAEWTDSMYLGDNSIRGGAWFDDESYCRVTTRRSRFGHISFRVCRSFSSEPSKYSGSLYVPSGLNGQGKISEIDLSTMGIVREAQINPSPTCVEYVAPNRLFVMDYELGKVFVLDLCDFSIIHEIPSHHGSQRLRVTPDGQYVYVLNYHDNTVDIIRTSDYDIVATVPTGTAPHGISFDDDNGLAYVSCHYGGTDVTIIDMDKLTAIGSINYGGYKPKDCAVHTINDWLYIQNGGSGGQNTCTVYDLIANQPIETFSTYQDPDGILLSQDNHKLYVTCLGPNESSGGRLQIFDTSNHLQLKDITVPYFPWRPRMHPEGTILSFEANSNGSVMFVDTQSDEVVGVVPMNGWGPGDPTFGPSGQNDLDEGLVAYYPLNGNADDLSGNGYDGIEQNGVSYVDGVCGQAASFDGIDDFIDLPDGFSDFTDGMTISMWVYTSSTSGRWPHFIDLGNGCAADNIILGRIDYSQTLCFTVHLVDSGGYITADDVIELDEWQHILVTEDRLGNVAMYVDGNLVAQGVTAVPENIVRTNNFIARSNWRGGDCLMTDAFFDGSLDEIYIYNRPLSLCEINELIDSCDYQNLVPIADAGGPYQGTTGNPVTLDASDSYDLDGSIELYEWDWDLDGIYDLSTSSPTCQHTWAAPFDGEIRLRVTDDSDAQDMNEASVVIELGAVPNEVDVTLDELRYDRSTGQSSATANIVNNTSDVISSPVWLVIKDISTVSITMVDPDGTTHDGNPYIDLTNLLGDGQLDPGDSLSLRLVFDNPTRGRFNFNSEIYGVVQP